MNNKLGLSASTQMAIEMLYGSLDDMDGLETTTLETRQKLVADLRSVADLLERAPHELKSVVFIAAEQFHGDQKGVHTPIAIMGSTPALAAAYLAFEAVGQQSMMEVLPWLVPEMESRAQATAATVSASLKPE